MKKEVLVYHNVCTLMCLLFMMACTSDMDINVENYTNTRTEQWITAEVALATAGTLEAELGDEQLAITEKLILSGPVDADDVNTFRKKMPSLKCLNMKGVTFAESEKNYFVEFDKGNEQPYSVVANEISEKMFYNMSNLQEIVLPDDIVSIGSQAFSKCTSISSIILPKSLETISTQAFEYCGALNSISFPEKLVSIGEKAFGATGFVEINLPENIHTIGNYAFNSCPDLEKIVFSDGIVNLGDNLLWSCQKLKEVVLPQDLKIIPANFFSACSSLTTIKIPQGVTHIYSNAFSGCSSLTDIILPSTLEFIGSSAFDMCTGLKIVTIPPSVKTAENGIFARTNLCALFWNTSADFPDIYKGGHPFWSGGNSNCLFYLADKNTKILVNGWHNFIIDGVSDGVVLNGASGDFHCPQAFKTQKISFTQTFRSYTYPHESAGWFSLSLPFAPTLIRCTDGRILAPFNAEVENAKPFWLRRLTADGFKNVTTMEANTPYILAMPNNSQYAPEYNIYGDVEFSAENYDEGILIPVTTVESQVDYGPSFLFHVNYKTFPSKADMFLLNTDREMRRERSIFVRTTRDAEPFEAYVTNKNISDNTPAFFEIGISPTTTRSTRPLSSVPSIDDM